MTWNTWNPTDPIFTVTTTDGRWYRTYIQEADTSGIRVLDDNSDEIVLIPWSDVSSIKREEHKP